METLATKYTDNELSTITAALAIMESKSMYQNARIDHPQACCDYFRLRLAHLEREHFCVMYLNTQHQIICCEDLFTGTLDGAAVYPREVAKAALNKNAAAVIFAHNHPSGNPEPSQSDVRLTNRLQEALSLLDIRVLDHIIVTSALTESMAERGLI